MNLEELLEQAKPIARRLVRARTEILQEQEALRALIKTQRLSAVGELARPAHPNFETAMTHWAELDAGLRTADEVALRIAHRLDCLDFIDDERVLGLSIEARIDLMLLDALSARVGGN